MISRKDYSSEYASPALTVDVVIFTFDEIMLKVLLIKRENNPFKGFFALPGGFLKRGETSRQAALRVLKEKAGVRNVYLEQLYTFDDPKRDQRGHIVSVAYIALTASNEMKLGVGGDIQTPTFYPVDNLPRLAFDHKMIINYAVERLRYKLEYTNAAYSLLPGEFTLSHLQRVYEAVLGKELDKRNFRKKFLGLGLVKKIGRTQKQGAHRPAQLYEFKEKRLTELKRFF